MKKIILSILMLSLLACSNNSKEDMAIEICKKVKITNVAAYQSNDDTNIETWEDYANSIVRRNPNKKYEWKSKKQMKRVFIL